MGHFQYILVNLVFKILILNIILKGDLSAYQLSKYPIQEINEEFLS